MTIGEVMDDLPGGPSARPVRCIELAVCEPFNSVVQMSRKFRQIQKNLASIRGRDGLTGEFSNRVTEICCRHGSEV